MNYLKDLRVSRKKTQSEVANYLGVSYQAYAYYENGKRQMSVETAKKLATYFNVPASVIISDYICVPNSIEEVGIKIPIIRNYFCRFTYFC